MPDQASTTTTTTTPAAAAGTTKKRHVLWALVASALVVGAIVAGVFGSRAVANKKRRPIPIEAVTYNMVTEGLIPAVVQALSVVPLQERTTTTTTAPTSTAVAGSSTTGNTTTTATTKKPTTVFGQAIDSVKSIVGLQPAAPKFDPTAMVLPPGAVAVPSWKAAGDAFGTQAAWAGAAVANGRVVCYAKTGQEVIEQVSGEFNSPCEVIVLTQDRYTPYSINKMINVTSPKLIIGRPFRSPMLNSTNRIPRLFDVLAGGRLETRSVILVRGFGFRTGPQNEIIVQAGTITRVQVGGFFTATNCMLRERNNTRDSFEEEVQNVIRAPGTRSRQFGQLILVLGGRLHINGCRSFRFRPWGNGILNAVIIGRDITVVAGYCVVTGHYTYSGALWTSSFFVSGSLGLVMGGVLLFVGGNNVGANLMQFQIGWSCILGTYGGVLATIGWQYTSTNGVLFRSNGGQFGGLAGLTYMTGFVQGRAWGVAMVAGPGQSYAQATGMYIWVGGATCSYAISTAFFGVGASTYVGAGTIIQIGIPQIRSSVTASSSGCGFYNFVGAGTITHIYLPSYSVNLMRFNAGVGTDFFLGMGWANNINNTRFSLQLCNSFFGFGNQAFVGLGGAAFVRSYSNSRRLVTFGWPTVFTYTVAGTGVSSSGTKGQTIVVTKGGVTRYVYNKTTKSATQISTPHKQRTASPTVVGGGKGKKDKGAKRKAGAVGTRRKAQTDGTKMGSWLAAIADSTGGLDPSIANDNKVVVLQTTIMEGRKNSWTPPHPDLFKASELKTRWGGYAKILGDGLVDVDGDGYVNAAKDDGSAGFRPGLISANNSDCFLCSVGPGKSEDHIGGPGSCEVSEECKADNPVDAYAEATKLTTKNILPPAAAGILPETTKGNGDVVYPNTWLLWSELVVYCRSTDPDTDDASITANCLTKEYVEEVVKNYLLLNSTAANQGYQVTVAPAGLHAAAQLPNFAPDVEDTTVPALRDALSPEWNPDCQGWTKYDIQVAATDPKVEQHVLDVFEDFFADAADLEDTILSNWDQNFEEELVPCGITITEKGEQRFPSIKTMPAYKPSETFNIAPNLVLADDTSIEPVRSIVPGETYKIYVQNFPAGSKVDVKLLEGSKVDGPVVASIAKFDDDGTAELAWVAPGEGLDLAAGKYYLQAQPVDFPALFAFSQLFSFKDVNAAETPNIWMFDLKNL